MQKTSHAPLRELNTREIDQVSGGVLPAIPPAVKIGGAIAGTGAAGFGAGTFFGWLSSR